MATQGITKMNSIPTPNKTQVISEVKEIQESVASRKASKHSTASPALDCKLKPSESRISFEWEYPSVDAHVTRVREPVPFPGKLNDVIAWTDAFIDRIASMTLAQQEESEADKNEIGGLKTKLKQQRLKLEDIAVALDNSRSETTCEREKVQVALAKVDQRDQIIKQLHDAIDKDAEEDELRNQKIKELTGERDSIKESLDNTTQYSKKLEEKLKEVSAAGLKKLAQEHKKYVDEHKKHEEDHNALNKARRQCEEEREARKKSERELLKVKQQLTEANFDKLSRNGTIKGLNIELVSLRTQLTDKTKSITRFEKDIKDKNKTIEDSKRDLANSEKQAVEIQSQLKSAQEQICVLSNDIETAQAKIASQGHEINDLKSEKQTAAEEIKKLTYDLTDAKNNAVKLEGDREAAKVETETVRANLTTELNTEKQRTEAEKKKADSIEKGLIIVDKNLTEHKKELKTKQDEINNLEKKLSDMDADHSAVLESWKNAADVPADRLQRLEGFEAENKKLEAEKEALKAEISGLKNNMIPNPRGKRINILSAEYGSCKYTEEQHKALFDKMYKAAESNQDFCVNNTNFAPDPWRGIKKSFSITYQLDGKGAPLHLVGQEGAKVRF